jgi:hypothetical protein
MTAKRANRSKLSITPRKQWCDAVRCGQLAGAAAAASGYRAPALVSLALESRLAGSAVGRYVASMQDVRIFID